jgi:predicted O-linked N-acetylglucosamine transferase (SPINDLY family)
MQGDGEQAYRRGLVRLQAGDFAAALAAFDAALQAAPSVPAIHYDRGNSLAMMRRLEEAVDAYGGCLALDPSHAGAMYNRALALAQLQRWSDALAALDALVAKYPDMADAWNNRCGVLQAMGRLDEALKSIEQAVRLHPSDARALYNAGLILLLLNRFDEAQQTLGRALQIQPGNGEVMGAFVSAALRACDWESLEPLLPRLFSGTVVVPPLALLALTDDPYLQRRFAEHSTRQSLMAVKQPVPMADRVYSHARLRIGYLSSDFRDHPVAAQIAGLLENHDRSRFDVIGLFTGQNDQSPRHHRIVKACDSFHAITGMGAHEAASLIRQAEIDILVDLNGHTLGWRPAILQHRPAPVIAGFLGYAGTTGAPFIDYIIGDPQVTPFELAPALSEKIVQLPGCFWPHDPKMPMPEPVSRAEAGLPPDAFVFCCFNSHHKIRPPMFQAWMRLLQAVPDGLLWLRDGGEAINQRFRHQARLGGIDQNRLHFAGRMESFAKHLGRQAQADLFLDTFPYNAHATASDALWAGLPLVSLRGQSFVSRVAASLLTHLGLEELVASSLEDYEALALSLAQDRARRGDIRRRLAETRETAPLFDMAKFARGIEDAFLEMHIRARRGEPPAAFRVSQRTLNI